MLARHGVVDMSAVPERCFYMSRPGEDSAAFREGPGSHP